MSQFKETTTTIRKVELIKVSDKKGRLLISDKMLLGVTKAHMLVQSGIEWAGLMLYSIKSGSLRDLDNIELIAKDFMFVSIGSGGTIGANTEVNITEHMPSFIDKFPSIFEGVDRIGMLHSHHSMATFFSNVDEAELEDNTKDHNLFYVSLIVNYNGRFNARLAFPISINIDRKDEKEQIISMQGASKKVGYIDLEIIIERDSLVNEIEREEERKIKEEKEKAKKQQLSIGFSNVGSESGSSLTKKDVDAYNNVAEIFIKLFANKKFLMECDDNFNMGKVYTLLKSNHISAITDKKKKIIENKFTTLLDIDFYNIPNFHLVIIKTLQGRHDLKKMDKVGAIDFILELAKTQTANTTTQHKFNEVEQWTL
jgi:hypothetical protein